MGRSRFVVLTLAFALVASGCAWTQEGGNAGRTGYAPFEKTLTTANVSQATVKWWASAETRSPVIGNGFLYGSDGQALRGWQISTCTSSAQSCLPGWTTSNPVDAILDPALSGKHVLTAGLSNGRWALDAYDGTGHERCTTTSPVACSPLWSADLGANAPFGPSLLTVADGLAYVRGAGATEGGPTLVFDASGNSGCSGSPRTCSPLFQLEPSGPVLGPMAVSAGRAFFPTATGIEVFDANGTSGCSTGRCSALARFSISSPTPPSAESGTLFTTSGSTLYAFDTTLERNCTIGALRTCTAIWRATLRSGAREQPVIAGGRVFVATSTGSASTNAAEVFDAAGVLSCSATSHVCSRLWLATPTAGFLNAISLAASSNLLIMATSDSPGGQNVASHVEFFDLQGTTGCAGSPRVCTPVASTNLGSPSFALLNGRLAVANGLVVVPRSNTPPTAVGLP